MSHQDLTDRLIQFYQNFYREEVGNLAQSYPDEQRSLTFRYEDLYRFDKDLAEDYRNKPDQMREYAEEALRLYDLPADVSLSHAHARITGVPENVEIGKIRVHDDLIGRLVSLRGVVRKTTDVRPKLSEAAFECQRCGTMTYIPQGREYQEPHECQGCERQGPFRVNFDQSEFIDFQELRVQATAEGVGPEEVPASIEVELADDLCGEVSPGDHVAVVGVLHTEQLQTGSSGQPTFDLYVDAHSVTPTDKLPTELTEEDEEEIIRESSRDDVYERLVASIAPSIRGLEEEKLAVLLQLFSGITKKTDNGEAVRGQIHLLFVGDPAVGLSRILRSASTLSPRSTYSNGAETSKAGITAAAARTGGADGPWELEAGALPIADRGLAAIDNFAKLDGDVEGALTEPMGQQQITISKASIHESIDTRVGVLAAGSPEYGKFDQYAPIEEQLPVDTQLFSLFDLIFTVTDTPDPDEDEEIANHVLDLHQSGEQRKSGDSSDTSQPGGAPLRASFIRKYITHAREVNPVMSGEAKDHITEFYVDIRSRAADEDAPVPISARKLEAVVRLSEASARVRLSDSIEVEDAKRATALVESTLTDLGVDPDTEDSEDEGGEASDSTLDRDQRKQLKSLISDVEQAHERGAPMDKVLDRSDEIGMDPGSVKAAVEKLRNLGEVYEPRQDHLRTT